MQHALEHKHLRIRVFRIELSGHDPYYLRGEYGDKAMQLRRLGPRRDDPAAIIVDDEKTQSLLPVAKALSEHNLRNYDIALVLCWFVAERYIHDLWNKLVANKAISSKRKDKLKGRDYTASVKTEILELNGLLSASRYGALNATRTVRNGIAHQFGRRHATKQESTAALTLVREIIEETMSLQFPFHTGGVPVHGV